MTLKELQDLVSEKQAVALYFKNDSCAPCMALRPKVEELITKSFPKMEFVLVDTKTQPELTSAFNVFANPTILVFFEGKEFIRKSKYIGVAELGSEINRIYQLAM